MTDHDPGRDKQPLQFNLNRLKQNTDITQGLLKASVLMFVFMPFLFFSGFLTLGTFIFLQMNADFFKTAELAPAKVVNVTEKYTTSYDTNTSGYETARRKAYQLVTVEYQTNDNQTVIAKRSDGETTNKESGDSIMIYYDPKTPSDIRFDTEIKNSTPLKLINRVAFTVFLLTVAALYLYTRHGKKRF